MGSGWLVRMCIFVQLHIKGLKEGWVGVKVVGEMGAKLWRTHGFEWELIMDIGGMGVWMGKERID